MGTIYEVAPRGSPFGLPQAQDYAFPMAWRWAPGAPNHDAVLAPGQEDEVNEHLDALYRAAEAKRVRRYRELIAGLQRALRQCEPDHPLLYLDAEEIP